MTGLGARIRYARHTAGWTQARLAERLRVSRPAVTHWENEENEPSVGSLRAICELFHVDANWLLGIGEKK